MATITDQTDTGTAPPDAAASASTSAVEAKHRRALVVGGKNGKTPWRKRHLIGLVAVLFIGWVAAATLWTVGQVEDDLERETRADLAAAGFDTTDLDVDFSFRDGTINTPTDGTDLAAAIAAGAVTADLADDITVRSTLERDPVLVDDAAPASTNDQDADPAPAAAPEPAASADAPAETEATDTTPVIGAVPAGPPAFVPGGTISVTATQNGGDRLVLEGTVPTGAQRTTLILAARSAFGSDRIDDNLEVSGEAPGDADATNDRITYFTEFFVALREAESGTATLTDAALSITVATASPFVSASVTTSAAEGQLIVPAQVTINRPVQLDLDQQVSGLQNDIDTLADQISRNIVFSSGSADLNFSGRQTLNQVVAAMTRFPDAVLAVSGHTDDTGDPANNVQLSQERAEAVTNYLVSQGISAERLTARGAGPNEPIASNQTEEGKAANRRVQFDALPQFS